jgi:thymidylate synthase ThyX
VRRMRHARLEEVRRLGGLLHEQAREVVPSLVILADEEAFRSAYGIALQDAFFREVDGDLAAAARAVAVPARATGAGEGIRRRGDVSLLDHTADPDSAVISALLFVAGRGPLEGCLEAARRLTEADRQQLVRGALAHLSAFDGLPRAFEEAAFRFEIVIDASALAQLKRHRMSTQHWGPYDPDLGFTVPPVVEEIGERAAFAALMERTAEAYAELRSSLEARGERGDAAVYALTNAYRRRVAVTMNLREVYHFSRLREDRHAQWAIRRIAGDISALVREVAPATSLLLAGKDRFAEVFAEAMAEGVP